MEVINMEQYEKDELLAQKDELALILCAKYLVEESKLKDIAKSIEDKHLNMWLALSHMKWNFLVISWYNINMAKPHNLQSDRKIDRVSPNQIQFLRMKKREEEGKPKPKKKGKPDMNKTWQVWLVTDSQGLCHYQRGNNMGSHL